MRKRRVISLFVIMMLCFGITASAKPEENRDSMFMGEVIEVKKDGDKTSLLVEGYLKGCEILRKHFENPALTTDVIVGFPGETEEEFAESKAMIEQADFYETHIFKYSRRQGTRADGMENQVLEQVKTERSHVLIQLGKEHMEKYMSHFVGQEVEILFEETMEIKGETYWTGHTKEYLRAAVKTEKNLENCIRTGKVVDSVEDGIFICTI